MFLVVSDIGEEKTNNNLVFKPTILLQHFLAFDCALETVKLEFHLWNRINQSLEHILE